MANTACCEEALDSIESFCDLQRYCVKFSPEHLVDVSNPTAIKILQLNGFPPEVEFSLNIQDDFHVEAYRRHRKVPTRDLINL